MEREQEQRSSYQSFWSGVGTNFPSLKGAASTAYYAECEQILLDELFGELDGALLFKTDLWDEAKNTEILRWAAERGARIAGVDIALATAEEAREVLAARRPLFAAGDVRAIPFADASVDLCLAFTVFSSILDDRLARDIAAEMRRVTKPGGSMLIYDFRYRSRNRNTRPISSSSIRRLFNATPTDVASLTLIPPLARALGPFARWAYRPLAAVPVLRAHQLVLVTKS